MIIVMGAGAAQKEIRTVIARIKALGYTPHPIFGKERTVIGAIGDERGKIVLQGLESLPGVERVVPILKPYKLASREVKPERTVIRIAPGVTVGDRQLLVIAGPCSVESEAQMIETALAVKKAGAHVLRGGAWKPRTSPYAFQGLELKGLKILRKANAGKDSLVAPDKESQETLDAHSVKITLVDYAGTFADQRGPFAAPTPKTGYRMLGAIIPLDDQLFFVKGYGAEKTVEAHADKIRGFLQSLKPKPAADAKPSGSPP